ncbi:MAG: flagellar protein FlgN [Gammaproteobacteria bacterium]|nr:flagellar protein FlgN [Gammaproteobacteria bacterium]
MTDQRILELLLSDIDTAQQLLDILEQEFSALSERDLNTLQALLAQKQPALRLLEQHSTERSQLLLQHNMTADQQGLTHFAAQSALGAQLLDHSATLNTLIEQCQHANMRNGRLIRSNQISVNSMLNIIRGTDAPTLYDNKGNAASSHKQRPFSQA